jgi:uncharacterized protein (TIGR02266 family)
MSDDRRTARRARLTGVRVTYETATEHQQAEVIDLSREGLFIAAVHPLAIGKRISLEIAAAGEPSPWPALGRVVWVREQDQDHERPAGMAVKFIDVEDSVIAAIDRLIETRERTEPGLGISDPEASAAPAPPTRERTMLGVGARPVSVAPVVVPAPGREATILGVGGMSREPSADPREPSLAIDLVSKKGPSTRPPRPEPRLEPTPQPAPAPAPPPAMASEPPPAPVAVPASTPPPAMVQAPALAAMHESEPPPAPVRSAPRAPAPSPVPDEDDSPISDAPPRRRSGVGWVVLLLLLAGGGAAGYVYRARVLPVWHMVAAEVTKRLQH